MKKQFLLSLLLVMAAACSVAGQNVPQGINYQCIVRNNQTGDPIVNQTVTLLFSLRNGSQNGPVDYQEKQVSSTNEFGLVNLVIGRGQPQVNTFPAINWGAGSKYLTVLLETSPNVFDEIGNSELLSVPYALYAQNGGGGGGTDNWGSQTAFTNNGVTGNGLANNPIGLAPQGAQSGQVLKWNGTAWTPADDLQATGSGGGTVTQVNTGTGLQGGPITTTGSISLTNTGVTPGIHGSATEIPVITVDAQGRITHVEKVIVQPGSIGMNSGTGINVVTNGFNNFTINNTGDTNAADDVTITSAFDGDVSGVYNNLQLKANVVTSNELNNGAVTAPKLSNMGAAPGEILKWNGTTWVPAADNSGTVFLTGGNGINITGASPNFTITNSGDTNAADDLTNTSQANGDVSGPFSDLQIKPNVVTSTEIAPNAVITSKIADGAVITSKLADNSVTSIKILDGNVTTADLADKAVTGIKIDNMGATNGQVLKYNGTTWGPAVDATGNFNVLPGAGIDVTQSGNTFIVINAGDTDASDDLTNATVFNGDVTGPWNNLQLKAGIIVNADMAANSIGTNNLINGAVTAVKLNNMGAANGQVLQYNGTTWAPATPNIAGDNWGAQTAVTNASLSGNGSAANPLGIAPQGAANGQVLRWNGTAWVPGTMQVGAALTGNGTLGSPFNLAQQGANNGQILQWNGVAAAWVPVNLPAPAGDNWGAQTAQVGAALVGNGTAGLPLNLAQQGATNGQILQWNGAWIPATLPAAAGDDWGVQTAQVGNALTGNGTVATPLNLAKQNANPGEVLKWNGVIWQPSADITGGTSDNYIAGPGISVTGASPNFIINNTGDADNNPTNELQAISLAGNTLSLSSGGGSVILPAGNNYAEGAGIDITGAAPNFTITNVGDLSSTNELQNLAIAGNVLSISNGNAVNIPVGPTYTAGNGISLAGNAITNIGDLSNTNEIQNLTLTGSILDISGGNNVDLAPLLSMGGDDWGNVANHIFNSNSGNVLIGTNVNATGKLQVVNADAANEAGRFIQTGGNKPALSGESAVGPGGFFTSGTGPALITNVGNVGIGVPNPAARVHIVGLGESMRLEGPTPSIGFVPTGPLASAPGYARMANNLLSFGTNDGSNVGLFPNGNAAVVANGANGFVGIGQVNNSTASLRVLQKAGGILLENQANGNFWEFSASPVDGTLRLFNSTLGAGIPVGTFTAAGLYVPSDRRLKTDIEEISNGVLAKFLQLNPVTYRYNAEAPDAAHSMGFLAQDVQEIFPELVRQSIDQAGQKGYLSINYGGFGVLAVKAIQEQQAQINGLKKENAEMRTKTASLEARLERLEKLMGEK